MSGYKIFTIEDPSPWLDQFVETINIMVKKCGGTSAEFVLSQLLKGRGHPNHLILAACEDGSPLELTAWLLATYIHDTLAPWVEVWGLWCKPGSGKVMRELGSGPLIEWSREKGAVRIVSILTRSPRVFLRMFHESLGFKQVGIVIEKELKSGNA